MNVTGQHEDADFRAMVRAFLATAVPDDIRSRIASGLPVSKEQQVRWQRVLHARGWIAPGWPAEWGGCDWTALQRFIFEDECVLADAPFVHPFGLFRVGPVIFTFGTEAQKSAFLPPILSSTHWWCQGYSEPGAGSDLAALSTSARRADGHYIVNGRKIWTSGAHHADWMFALVRTGDKEARGSQGISFMLIDMRAKGITVRPITTVDGLVHVNEVTLDDVEVPLGHRIGEEGAGWTCSRFLLGFERFQIAEVAQSARLMRQLERFRQRNPVSAALRDAIARAAIDLEAHRANSYRLLCAFQANGMIGPEVSMLKVRGSEIRQQLMALILRCLGPRALMYEPEGWNRVDWPAPVEEPAAVAHALYSRGSTIYGGSNEIQRDILARELLPR